ncbi:MAG: hypothetical protein LZ168_03540 [Thaumarchaeota archaeon]|nr:hypothetical protein [Candidatus Geocrenenecus arthurdayi]
MAIRLRLKLVKESNSVEVTALVNSGFETLEPEILVPSDIARNLSLYPQLPQGAMVKEYKLADGSSSKLIKISKIISVYAVEEDRMIGPVESSLTIAEKAEEPLISDKLAGKLGIVALDFGEGLWCFKDEIGRVTRKSR